MRSRLNVRAGFAPWLILALGGLCRRGWQPMPFSRAVKRIAGLPVVRGASLERGTPILPLPRTVGNRGTLDAVIRTTHHPSVETNSVQAS